MAIVVNRKATWDVTEERETTMPYTRSPLVTVSMSRYSDTLSASPDL